MQSASSDAASAADDEVDREGSCCSPMIVTRPASTPTTETNAAQIEPKVETQRLQVIAALRSADAPAPDETERRIA